MRDTPYHDPRYPLLNRRQLITTIPAVAASTSVLPGFATAKHDNEDTDQLELTATEIDQLENKIAGIFGSQQPLRIGITYNDPDEDDDLFGSITNAIALGGSKTTDDSDGPTVVECANFLCDDQLLEVADDVDAAASKVASYNKEFTRETFRAQHLLGILVEQGLVNTFTPDDIAAVRQSIPDATRYLPLIGSFNNVMQTACTVDESKPKTVVDFYLAVAAFCIEVAFFQFAVGYNIAFKSTHFLATRTTFARLLHATSPRTHGFILSEVHWAIREIAAKGTGVAAANTVQFVQEVTTEMANAPPQDGIEGTVTEFSVTGSEVTQIDMFDCAKTDTDAGLLDWLFDDDTNDVDQVSDRMKTIVSDCSSDDQGLFSW